MYILSKGDYGIHGVYKRGENQSRKFIEFIRSTLLAKKLRQKFSLLTRKGNSINTIYAVRVHQRPLSWTQLEPHSEEVEGFLALLRFEQRSELEKLSKVLK